MSLPESFWTELEKAVALAERERARLLAEPGIVAVGAGQKRVEGRPSGRAAIIVTVDRKLALDALEACGRKAVPEEIEGVAVDVVEQDRTAAAPADAEAMERARAVKKRIVGEWLGQPNVTGVGVGYKEVGGERTDIVAIRIYVERKLAADQVAQYGWPLVPKALEEVPTDVIELPPMRPAEGASGSRADRKDPLVGGCSIGTGNHPFSRGTYGATVFDRATGAQRVLSNAHVLDGAVGENVIQPAPVGLDDSIEVGFQLDVCLPIHFFRFDTPNTTLGTVLAGAAVAAAVAAALSDEIDPTRRGQDGTEPQAGALTLGERHLVKLAYPELPIPGTPFAIDASWKYERQTTAGDLSFDVSERRQNPHVLQFKALLTDSTRYGPGDEVHLLAVIVSPRVERVRRCSAYHCTALLTPVTVDRLFPIVLREVVEGDRVEVLERFGPQLERLFNQGENSELLAPLTRAACLYVGRFVVGEGVPAGPWRHYLYVQTVNTVPDGTKPEIAAQTIGGLPVSQNMRPVLDVGCGPFIFEDGQFDIELI